MEYGEWTNLKPGDKVRVTKFIGAYRDHFDQNDILTVHNVRGYSVTFSAKSPDHQCRRGAGPHDSGTCGSWISSHNFQKVEAEPIPAEELKKADNLPKSVNPDDVMGFFT